MYTKHLQCLWSTNTNKLHIQYMFMYQVDVGTFMGKLYISHTPSIPQEKIVILWHCYADLHQRQHLDFVCWSAAEISSLLWSPETKMEPTWTYVFDLCHICSQYKAACIYELSFAVHLSIFLPLPEYGNDINWSSMYSGRADWHCIYMYSLQKVGCIPKTLGSVQ